MKKSTFLLIAMMLMGSLVSNAQWSVTPEAGITAVYKKEGFDANWNAGWKIGAGLEYRFKESPFSLKSGLYYTQRGYKEYPYSWGTDDLDNYTMLVQGEINRHILQLPVMAQVGWDFGQDIRLNVAVGGYVGYYIKNGYSYNFAGYTPYPDGYGYGYGYSYGYGYDSHYRPFDGLRKFNWGLTGSVGLEIKQWVINASYEAAMAKEYKWDDVAFKFHTISLSLGYKFKL